MFHNFQEDFRSIDVKPTEFKSPDQCPKPEIPSMDDLKSKLEDIFSNKLQEGTAVRSDIPAADSSITLNDGTTVKLPDTGDTRHEVNGSDVQKSADVSQNRIIPTRELPEDEKERLKETLDWTDKQISKCTIDADGVIHYKTDREDMEGKAGENGVRYERKTVDIHDIKIQGVFPVFESICDVQLPEDLERASNARQFKECNKQLKENLENDPTLKDSFTDEQLEEIEDGDTPSGYVWHHNEETGKMQLVKIKDHDRTQGGAAHTGGKALWGGSYSNHETTSTELEAISHPK